MNERRLSDLGAVRCLLLTATLLISFQLCHVVTLRAQDAADVTSMLISRVGDPSLLRVPDVENLPQPRLPGGELDPRFAITLEKVRLGRLLFFDPVRSNHIQPEFGGLAETTQTASCGTCHIGPAASKAGVVVSLGVGGEGRFDRQSAQRFVSHFSITRTAVDGAEDLLPTPAEELNELG